MGQRSKVDQLPDDVLAELNGKLVAGRFTGFEALEEWLRGQGFAIGKSSIHRYGSKFEEQINRLRRTNEMAKAIVAEAPDDENAMNAALTRMVQHRLFELVDKLEMEGVEVDPMQLPKIARAVADIGRGSISQLKYMAEVREKFAEADKKVSADVKAGRIPNVTPEALAQIRAIYTGAVVGPG